jgi:hypothetical protein
MKKMFLFILMFLFSISVILVNGQINKQNGINYKRLRLINQSYFVKVDYNHSLEDMIKTNKYNFVVNYINICNYPNIINKTEINIVLLNIKADTCEIDSISREEILKSMNHDNLRPATLIELLAFDKSFPNVKKFFDIYAIGSIWQHPNKDYLCPYIGVDGRGKKLHVVFCDYFIRAWNEPFCFLAVYN